MANKMLIDATHAEETRVVVVKGTRVEDFDFESQSRRPLKANIYLAQITRVEPSLQACFVEYGGNRQGFLAFSEIHPDYYQIPVADREALLAEEAMQHEEEEQENPRAKKRGRNNKRRSGRSPEAKNASETPLEENAEAETQEENAASSIALATPNMSENTISEPVVADDEDENEAEEQEDEQIEMLGGIDDVEETPYRVGNLRKQYKIQEVIKRRQVVLIQVSKEERGNKGAALTTYLSLAGRYAVLMPNTARGGGVSRKITNAGDRKRLKEVVEELDVPQGMGIILRTAGANQALPEIKRDFEYLIRVWENVRDLTLKSTAPKLVHEEGSLVKRSLRDLFGKDVDEVHVAGDEAFHEAKDFMKMLLPSHAKHVHHYQDKVPLFARFGVESQLDGMFSHTVTLKSGGYIVLNQTEALVAIDVNSGRATREHHIEDTALKTNLEAADEVARQLRLRDLAGLVVVDFIDMEENRNNRLVEKRMKEALKNDRARIQVGRISHFGLLEMSRQRLRSGVLESSSERCQVCAGSGFVRAKASVALHLLRAIEEQLLKNAQCNLIVKTKSDVALYVLNQKRAALAELEARFKISITIEMVDEVEGQATFTIQKGEMIHSPENAYRQEVRKQIIEITPDDDEAQEDDAQEEGKDGAPTSNVSEAERERRRKRRRRKKNKRQENGEPNGEQSSNQDGNDESDEGAANDEQSQDGEPSAETSEPRERTGLKRGKYGRIKNRRDRPERTENPTEALEPPQVEAVSEVALLSNETPEVSEAPAPAPRARRAKKPAPVEEVTQIVPAEPVSQPAPQPIVEAAPEPEQAVARRRRTPDPEPVEAEKAPASSKKGWWSRTFGQ